MRILSLILAVSIAFALAQDEPTFPLPSTPRVIRLTNCRWPLVNVAVAAGDFFNMDFGGSSLPTRCGFNFLADPDTELEIDCNTFNLIRGQKVTVVDEDGTEEYTRRKRLTKKELNGSARVTFTRRRRRSENTRIFCTITAVSSNTETTATTPSTTTATTPSTTTATTPSTTTSTTTATTPSTTTTRTTSTTTASSQCKCGTLNPGNRIVGGEDTDKNEYPYQVGLVSTRSPDVFCGGTLISDRWIVTAAHCTISSSPSSFNVLLGGHTRNPITDGTIVSVKRIINHPSYSSRTLDNDISLIEIDPIDLNSDPNINPVCLPTTNNLYENTEALVTGWGTLTSGGVQPNVLQEVSLPTITNSQCSRFYRLTSNMICAFESGKDSCQGDSGGPLVSLEGSSQATLIGVVSFGSGCGTYPGVYTRVTNYISWINTQTGGLNTCPM